MNKHIVFQTLEAKLLEDLQRICIIDETRRLTNRDFLDLIRTVADQIPPESKRVGIVMEHSVEMVAAIFAVLLRGGAYVPAEPFLPQKRIDYMFRDAGVSFVITSPKHRERFQLPGLALDAELPLRRDVDLTCTAQADSPAYILYTSGSTGYPKGVVVRNRNVCHYVRAFQQEFRLTASDVMLQYSVCSFDIFVEEVFASLLNGAALAIPSARSKSSLEALLDFVQQNHITVISGFPYLLMELNDLGTLPDSVRILISGGDVLRASYVDRLLDHCQIYNTYGPTETTVCCTYFHCNGYPPLADGTYPIGKPVLGAEVYLSGPDGRITEPGVEGELCILGGGVSAGYLCNPEATKKAFEETEAGTVYHSGDLGYLLPDGNFGFLHRLDTQVMILGRRVEPSGVESILCRCAGVKSAVVIPYRDQRQLHYMVAYVIPNDPTLTVPKLRDYLQEYLPVFMIPEFIILMEAFPLTINGKIDRSKLPVVNKA